MRAGFEADFGPSSWTEHASQMGYFCSKVVSSRYKPMNIAKNGKYKKNKQMQKKVNTEKHE